MGGRDKRSRAVVDEEKTAAWIAAVSGQVETQAAPPLVSPDWPAPAAAFGARMLALASTATRPRPSVSAAFGLAATLRMALAFRCRVPEWFNAMEAMLSDHIRTLRSEDIIFSESARTFYSSGGASMPGTAAPSLRDLKARAALDALLFALWALAARRTQRVPHPVRVNEAIERVYIASEEGGRAVRRVLRLDSEVATSWGAAPPSKTNPVWLPGASALLRLLRARWVEAIVLLEQLAASTGADAVDVSVAQGNAGARLRVSLHRWWCTGRDCGARHLSFAVPSPAAIRLICGGHGSIVELGAGNGYWSTLCQRHLASRGVQDSAQVWAQVWALDISPPPPWQQKVGRRPRARVCFGSAEDLERPEIASAETLLLCMPSPGESTLAEDALRAFRGPRVAYVGEWCTGMTGTRVLHAILTQEFRLVAVLPLPAMLQTRVALHVFERLRGAAADAIVGASPAKAHQVCAVCAVCGSAATLRQCPWSRSLIACSDKCWRAAEAKHLALLEIAFCGARCSDRPAFEVWDPVGWLEAGQASERDWFALAEATPQPERLT